MTEHPAVVERFRRWSRHLGRAATAATVAVVAAATVASASPSTAADHDRSADAAAASQPPGIHAPLPSAAVGTDGDTGAPTGPGTTSPHGQPAETPVLVVVGQATNPDISATQAPASAPIGSGLTRAPPVRFTRVT